MATLTQIKRNIDNTREDISVTVDEISNLIHKKVDLQEKIKENPYGALLTALAAGFALASFSSPIGRTLLRISTRAMFAAAGAYASKQGLNLLSKTITNTVIKK